jgi:hypothetical protein
MSNVEVKIFHRKDGTLYARVELSSNIPGLTGTNISFLELDFDMGSTLESFVQAIQAAGGALGDYQNKEYGDRHEPTATAKAAGELFMEIWEELKHEDKTKAPISITPKPHNYEDGAE